MAGMKVEFSGSYMGWNPNPKSDILEHVLKVYKEQNGTDKGGSFVTVVRLETKLRATLTEQQKALFEQIKKRM